MGGRPIGQDTDTNVGNSGLNPGPLTKFDVLSRDLLMVKDARLIPLRSRFNS